VEELLGAAEALKVVNAALELYLKEAPRLLGVKINPPSGAA